jgi:hypothetical protein
MLAALLACSAAWADPPARVGRLNLIQGSVSLMTAEMDGWTAATLNYPLTAGDSLWTNASSRTEVHVASTAIRLGAGTELSFLELDDQSVRIHLPQGLLSVRLRELEPGESFAVDTPTMSVLLLAPGSCRIEVAGSGDTRAVVSEGEIEALVDGLAYPVRAAQAAFVAQSDPPSIRIGQVPRRDGWDRWCAERDRREDRLASVQYVPRTMVGCEDLDWYGSWSVTVEYGPVWTPFSLPAGWAPYRYGHWAWVQPWGWTWIDDMPWGFAPFHYGRWALVRGRWVWVPGAKVQRPVYAPALVAFADAVANGRIDASRTRYAHREAGQVCTQGPQQRESVPAASKWLLGAVSRLAQEWQSRQSQEPKAQRNRGPKFQQKTLANGQVVWVEEWVPVQD